MPFVGQPRGFCRSFDQTLSNFSFSLNTVLQTYEAVCCLLTTWVNAIKFLLKERENISQAAEAIVRLRCPFRAVILIF